MRQPLFTDDQWAEHLRAIDELAVLIRRVAKGEGVFLRAQPSGVDARAFGAEGSGGIINALHIALMCSPGSLLEVQAIANALAMTPTNSFSEFLNNDGALLKRRREAFATQHSISLRTTMRLEEKGAYLLAEFIQKHLVEGVAVELAHELLGFALEDSPFAGKYYDHRGLSQAQGAIRNARKY